MFIEIKLIGQVALDPGFGGSIGYRYDVPFDELDIPYIPIGILLRKEGLLPENVQVGFAYPDGYAGILRAARDLRSNLPDARPHIRAYFTNSRTDKTEGYLIRSLKAGQRFYAYIDFPEEMKEQIAASLAGITQIGITDEDISGEVALSLVENSFEKEAPYELNPLCRYRRLDYSFVLVTPLCISAPFNDGIKALDYIPGTIVRDVFRKNASLNLEKLSFANAYLSDGNNRLLPVPQCTSVVKLDKKQLRYKLAPRENINVLERSVAVKRAFSDSVEGHLVRYSVPEFLRITTSDGASHDALMPGQIFRGSIYGSDAEIRKLVQMNFHQSTMFFGDHNLEGFGEVYAKIDQVLEREIPSAYYYDAFDLMCLSETILINEEGMPTCKGEDFLQEIERLLGLSGELEIERQYVECHMDYQKDALWKEDREITRCFERGTVFRIHTMDGKPVDISRIMHTFIGERRSEGYGEIMAIPAKGQYYRLAQNDDPAKYRMEIQMPTGTRMIGSQFTCDIINRALKASVETVAMIDIPDYKAGIPKEELVPTDILRLLKERYNPLISDQVIRDWYMDRLEVEDV